MGSGVRVAQMTSVHPADDVRILHRECRTLAEAGYDVRLIAPSGAAPPPVAGVTVCGIGSADGRLQRMTRLAVRAYRAARRLRARVYHLHDPELIPVGLALKVGGGRVIYDAHEDLPLLIAIKDWIHPMLRRPIAMLSNLVEAVAAHVFDGVVAATPAIGARFPNGKVVIVQNFPDVQELEPPASAVPYAERAGVAVYVGALTPERSVTQMAEAARLLPADLDPRFVLAGRFSPESLAADAQRIGGDRRIEIVGPLDRAGVRAQLSRARVGLVVLQPVRNHIDSYPTKLFEYMAAGLPVVASDFPLWRRIVDASGCGLLADPTDPQSIADAVEQLLRHPAEAEAMGRRGRRAVEASYTWEPQGRALVALYRRLTASEPRRYADR